METKDFNEMREACCSSEGNTTTDDSMRSHMKKCMKSCMKGGKWFMLIPGIIILTAFILTLLLEPEVARTMWLVITGIFLGIGVFFAIMGSFFMRKVSSRSID